MKTPEQWLQVYCKNFDGNYDLNEFAKKGEDGLLDFMSAIQSDAMAEQRERDAKFIENTDNPYIPEFEKPGLANKIRRQK